MTTEIDRGKWSDEYTTRMLRQKEVLGRDETGKVSYVKTKPTTTTTGKVSLCVFVLCACHTSSVLQP